MSLIKIISSIAIFKTNYVYQSILSKHSLEIHYISRVCLLYSYNCLFHEDSLYLFFTSMSKLISIFDRALHD